MPPSMPPGGNRTSNRGALIAVAVGFGVVVLGAGGAAVALRSRRSSEAVAAPATVVTPPPARPALRTCVIDQGPTPVGTHGAPDVRMRFAASGAELAVGWRVPRSRHNGTDDSAVARLDQQGRVVGWLDAEQRSTDGNPDWSPVSVRRVQPYAGGDGSLRYATTRVERTPVDETIRCGDFSSNWPVTRVGAQNEGAGFGENYDSMDGPVGAVGALRPEDLERPFFCAAVGDRAPIVIGVHGRVRRNGRLDDNAVAVAAIGGQSPVVIGEYPMRSAYRAMARSTNPLATLRETVSESVDAVEVTGRGYAVLMRQSTNLLVFWLSADLHPVAPMQTIATNNRESKADLVRGADGLLLLYADRESADRNAPFHLVGQRMEFGQAPGPRVVLRTSEAPMGEEVAPSASALASGGWVVSWTQRTGRTAAEQNVLVRSFNAALEPEGPARQVGVGLGDSRLHATGDRFVLVAFEGRRDDMPIVSHAGSCQR